MAEVSTSAEQEWQAAGQAAAKLARAVEVADIVGVLRSEYGFSQEAIGEACGVSERAVREWERGARVRQKHDDRLREFVALVLELSTTLTPRGVQQWLMARHPLLNWGRPIRVFGEGDEAAIEAIVQRLAGGDVV